MRRSTPLPRERAPLREQADAQTRIVEDRLRSSGALRTWTRGAPNGLSNPGPLTSSSKSRVIHAMAEKVGRRLAAVFAADMAGYSRLIGLDEEGTIARQQALRRELIDPRVAEHGGRIVKTLGDGLLVELSS